MNLEKLVNVITIVLVAALGIAGFMVMKHTAESNSVTANIAKIQSEHKSRVIQEVALLGARLHNLEKDMDTILEILKEKRKKNESDNR